MKSRMSSKLGQIGSAFVELPAFECLEISPETYNWRNAGFVFVEIFILAGNKDMH